MAKKHGDLIGDRFGKLVVIKEYLEPEVNEKLKCKQLKWLCRCDCGNEVVMSDARLKNETMYIRSCGCSKEKNPNYITKHISVEDKEVWNSLYDYVNNNVMHYKPNSLTKKMVTTLDRLCKKHSFSVVLNTFKFCNIDIQKSISRKEFYNEEIKFNYIIAIITNNIETIKMRMQNAEKSVKKTESMDMKTATHTGAAYQTKTEKTSKKLNDLW